MTTTPRHRDYVMREGVEGKYWGVIRSQFVLEADAEPITLVGFEELDTYLTINELGTYEVVIGLTGTAFSYDPQPTKALAVMAAYTAIEAYQLEDRQKLQQYLDGIINEDWPSGPSPRYELAPWEVDNENND